MIEPMLADLKLVFEKKVGFENLDVKIDISLVFTNGE